MAGKCIREWYVSYNTVNLSTVYVTCVHPHILNT
jgi:hypothetical protein